MLEQEFFLKNESKYYDRVFLKKIYQNGFSLNNDLTFLYQMFNQIIKYNNLSKSAKNRLKWFDYYQKTNNVSLTCRHFGISRKTFYKWKKKYNPNNLYSLEDTTTRPRNFRKPEITNLQEQRIIKLRKKYIRYSKFKLAKLYEDLYQESISSWKIQRVVQKYQIYHHPKKNAKTSQKRLKAKQKKRIQELRKKPKTGYLVCLDTIVKYCNGYKRYILTAIDNYSKVAFARMYNTHSSYNASDFLNRLMYLLDGRIDNIQTDNGSEFQKYFNKACQELNLSRYYSRVRNPKDNSVCERFNRTLQEEFIQLGNYTNNAEVFNRNLTNWLIEYNFHRPHTSLNYMSPINFNNSKEVLPMYSSRTFY